MREDPLKVEVLWRVPSSCCLSVSLRPSVCHLVEGPGARAPRVEGRARQMCSLPSHGHLGRVCPSSQGNLALMTSSKHHQPTNSLPRYREAGLDTSLTSAALHVLTLGGGDKARCGTVTHRPAAEQVPSKGRVFLHKRARRGTFITSHSVALRNKHLVSGSCRCSGMWGGSAGGLSGHAAKTLAGLQLLQRALIRGPRLLATSSYPEGCWRVLQPEPAQGGRARRKPSQPVCSDAGDTVFLPSLC